MGGQGQGEQGGGDGGRGAGSHGVLLGEGERKAEHTRRENRRGACLGVRRVVLRRRVCVCVCVCVEGGCSARRCGGAPVLERDREREGALWTEERAGSRQAERERGGGPSNPAPCSSPSLQPTPHLPACSLFAHPDSAFWWALTSRPSGVVQADGEDLQAGRVGQRQAGQGVAPLLASALLLAASHRRDGPEAHGCSLFHLRLVHMPLSRFSALSQGKVKGLCPGLGCQRRVKAREDTDAAGVSLALVFVQESPHGGRASRGLTRRRAQ